MWWLRDFLQLNIAKRPKLFGFENSKDVEWSGIKLINSPSFFMIHHNVEDFYYHDFEIYADIMG